jgi:hypothetical protein
MKTAAEVLKKFTIDNDSDNEETLIARLIIDSGISSPREAADICWDIRQAAGKIMALLLKEADKSGGWTYTMSLEPDQTYDTFADAVKAAREIGEADNTGSQPLIGRHQL